MTQREIYTYNAPELGRHIFKKSLVELIKRSSSNETVSRKKNIKFNIKGSVPLRRDWTFFYDRVVKRV